MCINDKRIQSMKKLFSKYFHSNSNAEEANTVLDYLKDQQNDSEITELLTDKWNRNLNETIENPKSNPSLFKRIIREINYADNLVLSRKLKIYKYSIGVAAVLMIGLIIGSLLVVNKVSSTYQSQDLQHVQTPYGVKTTITLPDGSAVCINSGTNISYPGTFGDSRNLKLVGEAYFDVQKSKKPFVVSTRFGDVTVHGTSFNVKAYPDEEYFEVTLVEGSVGVRKSNDKQSIRLKPGQHAYLENNTLKVKNAETKYYTSWKEGKMIFNREPFPNFIRKLERWYNIDIKYADPKLNELWYSGTIEMETISEVMDLISKAAPITYKYNSKNRVFTLKSK